MADVSPISVEDAYRRGHAVYELRLTNWGNIGAGADANSLRSNTVGRPILGAAISPDSDVPACIITRDLGRMSSAPILVAGTVANQDIVLTAGTPLLFPQAAGQTWSNAIEAIRVYPLGQDLFGDTYRLENGTTTPFGTTLPLTQFAAPELKVLLLFRGNALLASPRRDFRTQGTHIFGGGSEELVYAVPALGRRAMRVTARTEAGTTVDLRVTALVGRWSQPPIGPAVDDTKEAEVASAITIGPLATGTILVENPLCQWLLIKAQRTAGANDMAWTVRAVD